MKEKEMAKQIKNPAEWSVRFFALVGPTILPRISNVQELQKTWRRDCNIRSNDIVQGVYFSNEITGYAYTLESENPRTFTFGQLMKKLDEVVNKNKEIAR